VAICTCARQHYPLRYFRRNGLAIATRGERPVERILSEGWEEFDADERIRTALRRQYDLSHRFDWLHTPTYADDRETHLRMKAKTAR
jgi:hypothetical protein